MRGMREIPIFDPLTFQKWTFEIFKRKWPKKSSKGCSHLGMLPTHESLPPFKNGFFILKLACMQNFSHQLIFCKKIEQIFFRKKKSKKMMETTFQSIMNNSAKKISKKKLFFEIFRKVSQKIV